MFRKWLLSSTMFPESHEYWCEQVYPSALVVKIDTFSQEQLTKFFICQKYVQYLRMAHHLASSFIQVSTTLMTIRVQKVLPWIRNRDPLIQGNGHIILFFRHWIGFFRADFVRKISGLSHDFMSNAYFNVSWSWKYHSSASPYRHFSEEWWLI